MLKVNMPVRIDLSWYIKAYPEKKDIAYSSGHGKTGYISDAVVAEDGCFLYWITLDNTGQEIGGFGEKDLEVI